MIHARGITPVQVRRCDRCNLASRSTTRLSSLSSASSRATLRDNVSLSDGRRRLLRHTRTNSGLQPAISAMSRDEYPEVLSNDLTRSLLVVCGEAIQPQHTGNRAEGQTKRLNKIEQSSK